MIVVRKIEVLEENSLVADLLEHPGFSWVNFEFEFGVNSHSFETVLYYFLSLFSAFDPHQVLETETSSPNGVVFPGEIFFLYVLGYLPQESSVNSLICAPSCEHDAIQVV